MRLSILYPHVLSHSKRMDVCAQVFNDLALMTLESKAIPSIRFLTTLFALTKNVCYTLHLQDKRGSMKVLYSTGLMQAVFRFACHPVEEIHRELPPVLSWLQQDGQTMRIYCGENSKTLQAAQLALRREAKFLEDSKATRQPSVDRVVNAVRSFINKALRITDGEEATASTEADAAATTSARSVCGKCGKVDRGMKRCTRCKQVPNNPTNCK